MSFYCSSHHEIPNASPKAQKPYNRSGKRTEITILAVSIFYAAAKYDKSGERIAQQYHRRGKDALAVVSGLKISGNRTDRALYNQPWVVFVSMLY